MILLWTLLQVHASKNFSCCSISRLQNGKNLLPVLPIFWKCLQAYIRNLMTQQILTVLKLFFPSSSNFSYSFTASTYIYAEWVVWCNVCEVCDLWLKNKAIRHHRWRKSITFRPLMPKLNHISLCTYSIVCMSLYPIWKWFLWCLQNITSLKTSYEGVIEVAKKKNRMANRHTILNDW